MRARVGKIARLPLRVREELNHRLIDGEPASKVLPWLNSLEETAAVIAEMGEAGGHVVGAIDEKNLSDWRRGGYADWLRRREHVEQTRELASWSMRLATAGGGNLSEGASAILAGQLLELLEGLAKLKEADLEVGVDDKARLVEIGAVVDQVSKALANVRAGDHSKVKLDLERQRLAQGAEGIELERAKFQRTTCELFLKWYEDKRAREAVSGAGDNAAKLERLGQLMFGEDWEEKAEG